MKFLKTHFGLFALPLFWTALVLSAPRVISTSPQLTELFFQLGKGNSLVGASSFSDYPAEAKKIPVIGPLFMPGLEASIAKSPNWVVLDNSVPLAEYKASVERMGISTLHLQLKTIDLLFSESRRLLEKVYQETESPILTAYEKDLKTLKNLPKRKRKGLIFTWHDPVVLVGNQALLSDVAQLAGVENLAPASWNLPYPQVSREWLMNQKPEVILNLQHNSEISKDLSDTVKRIWPRNTPRILVLESPLFARASFTVIENLPNLIKKLEVLP